MNIKILGLLIVCLSGFNSSAQRLKADTLLFGLKLIVVQVPESAERSIHNYAEGIIVSYTSPVGLFTFFKGYNANVSPYKYELFDTVYVDEEILKGRVEDKNWQSSYRSNATQYWYNMVADEDLALFDSVFRSVKIIQLDPSLMNKERTYELYRRYYFTD